LPPNLPPPWGGAGRFDDPVEINGRLYGSAQTSDPIRCRSGTRWAERPPRMRSPHIRP